MQAPENSDGPFVAPRPRRGLKLAVLLAGGTLVIAAFVVPLGLGVFSLPTFLHLLPQPRTQLTVRLDTGAVPRLVVRTLSEDVRSLMRETRIGFASTTPSGDGGKRRGHVGRQ